MSKNNSTTKTFLLGALIGGAVGAISALLLAPKSGRELRRDIVDTTNDMYDKASDLIYEGKQKAQHIIDSAKQHADSILNRSTDLCNDANEHIAVSTESVQQRFENLKDAARSGADAFRAELKK